MTTYNPHKNELNVTIPAAGVHELYDYQEGLLGILAGIRVQECDEGLKTSIRSVYKLLGHLHLAKPARGPITEVFKRTEDRISNKK